MGLIQQTHWLNGPKRVMSGSQIRDKNDVLIADQNGLDKCWLMDKWMRFAKMNTHATNPGNSMPRLL